MFSSNVRNQWVPQAHNVSPSSIPSSGKGKEDGREATTNDLHNWPKSTGPEWLCLVNSLVTYSSQGTAGTTPAGFTEAFPFQQEAQEFSIQVVVICWGKRQDCIQDGLLWMRWSEEAPKAVYQSTAMKGHTCASSDHKLIISKESQLLGGAAVGVHRFPAARCDCPLWGLFGFLRWAFHIL